jgi:Icc-related predicted phosphoesterase
MGLLKRNKFSRSAGTGVRTPRSAGTGGRPPRTPRSAGKGGRPPRTPRSRDAERTIFFASDLHGSEVCFKKFVAAAKFYGADTLLLGGDVSAKIVVPVVRVGAGSYRAQFHGHVERLDESTVEAFERRAASSGLYTERMDPDEYQHYADYPEEIERLFDRVMRRTVQRWIEHAKTKLADSPVIIYNAPGNDDPPAVDEVLLTHGDERVRFAEGEIVEIAPGMEMLSTGYTNVTPWDTHREYSEEQIAEHLSAMTAKLRNPETAIFNIHVPPYNSRLDTAPLLGQDLKIRTAAGATVTAPVGSTSVRKAIENVQPLLTLHGHIHESGGSVKIGRTTAINVGSEYGEGVLRGVLIRVGEGRLLGYQAVSG